MADAFRARNSGLRPREGARALYGVVSAMTRHVSDWVAVLSPTGAIEFSGGGTTELMSHSDQRLRGRPFILGVEAEHKDRVLTALASAHARPGKAVNVDYRRRRADGNPVQVRTTFEFVEMGPLRGIVATTRLIVRSDSPDRSGIVERIDSLLSERDHPWAIAVVDLKNYRTVASALGHATSTHLLNGVVRRLRAAVGPHDLVGRIGPQEFAVLFDGTQLDDDVRSAIERMHARLRPPLRAGGREVVFSSSIGYVTGRRKYEDGDQALADAEAAAQRAPASRARAFQTAMRIQQARHMRLASELPRVFQRQELQLRYQPIVDLATGRISGVEALVRWMHPELGMISPTEFIPIAEATDWIVPLDRWVMEETAREIVGWKTELPLRLSVNLSAKHLDDPELTTGVAKALGKSGMSPHQLRLEITETALANDLTMAIEALHRLRKVGVTLAIDDFGTGYASFGQLADMPFDVLKVDRSMTSRMGQSARSVVPGIIQMAHQLGLRVVAEGIETEEQLAELRELGCEYGQGYLFATPLAGDKLKSLLSSGRTW